MPYLTLAFLRPLADDKWFNVLSAKLSSEGICHVELVFDGGLAFSIYDDRPPFLKQRTMKNPGYEFVTLSVSHQEYTAALQFCRLSVSRAYSFDQKGMLISPIHLGTCVERHSSELGKTFCSKIITEALQHADVSEVERLCASSATPTRLYNAIKDSSRRTCHNFLLNKQAMPITSSLLLKPG